MTTYAGSSKPGFKDGIANQALFDQPVSLALDERDGSLYVADYSNHRIRKISTDGMNCNLFFSLIVNLLNNV